MTVNTKALAKNFADQLGIRGAGTAYATTLADTANAQTIVDLTKKGVAVEDILRRKEVRIRTEKILSIGGTAALAGQLDAATR